MEGEIGTVLVGCAQIEAFTSAVQIKREIDGETKKSQFIKDYQYSQVGTGLLLNHADSKVNFDTFESTDCVYIVSCILYDMRNLSYR